MIPLGIENETRIDLRIVTSPVEQQETITRDSVTVKVNAVLWFRVTDPHKAVLTVENFRAAVQQVALTSLRNVIGQHDLDEVLKERDKINALLKRNVLENTGPWGITIELLEMKDVEIPQDMQRVMAMERPFIDGTELVCRRAPQSGCNCTTAVGARIYGVARLFPSLVGLSLQQGLHIGGLERKPPADLAGRVVEGSRDRRSRKGVGRF